MAYRSDVDTQMTLWCFNCVSSTIGTIQPVSLSHQDFDKISCWEKVQEMGKYVLEYSALAVQYVGAACLIGATITVIPLFAFLLVGAESLAIVTGILLITFAGLFALGLFLKYAVFFILKGIAELIEPPQRIILVLDVASVV